MPQEIRSLHIRTQAKLGAMDRVLGAFTHRGIIPSCWRSDALEEGIVNIHVEFFCAEDHTLMKLCKHLIAQVYILSIEDVSVRPICPPMGITQPAHPHFQPLRGIPISV
jgi:hypothetical protein